MAAGAITSPLRFATRNSKSVVSPRSSSRYAPWLKIFAIDLRHRQAVAAEMAGELKERDVFFADRVDNADGLGVSSGQPKYGAP